MRDEIDNILKQANTILLGKEKEIRLSLISIICNGHLLLEDIPGVGKTTLVYLIGKLFGFDVTRIQFTNDLLPSDIIGTNIYNKEKMEFSFRSGPIFGGYVLADELNRATPRTQSALLQAMEERKVSIDGKEYPLDESFLVVATQNPKEQVGTFPLPESQLDRFFMSLYLNFPGRDFEREILKADDLRLNINELNSILNKEALLKVRTEVKSIKTSDSFLDYVLDLFEYGRREWDEGRGLSPRAGKDLVLAAKGHAYLENRDFTIPEDVQAVIGAVLGHRLGGNRGVRFGFQKAKELIAAVPIP